MGFWEEATDQAGRQFGARYWRWFAATRAVRTLAPVISVVVILGALVLAYRLVSPDWSGIAASAGSWFGGWAPGAGQWALIVLGAVIVVALLVRVGAALWERTDFGWRLRMLFRRY